MMSQKSYLVIFDSTLHSSAKILIDGINSLAWIPVGVWTWSWMTDGDDLLMEREHGTRSWGQRVSCENSREWTFCSLTRHSRPFAAFHLPSIVLVLGKEYSHWPRVARLSLWCYFLSLLWIYLTPQGTFRCHLPCPFRVWNWESPLSLVHCFSTILWSKA